MKPLAAVQEVSANSGNNKPLPAVRETGTRRPRHIQTSGCTQGFRHQDYLPTNFVHRGQTYLSIVLISSHSLEWHLSRGGSDKGHPPGTQAPPTF